MEFFLNQLLQDDSIKDEKVKTTGDGIKLSSKEVVQEHNENILEGMSSIEDTMKTPGTGGQQSSPKIDGSKIKEDKGCNKHKHKKSKVTFALLLDKYRKKSEENGTYRPSNTKASRSPLGANPRISIGKKRILMQRVHILILGCQCQCRGCLPMLM